MARKLDSKGDPINRNRRAAAAATASVHMNDDTHVNAVRATYSASEIVADCMKFFVEHDDGFLKVRRSLDSVDLHVTYSWSSGPHAGCYVYSKVEYWQLAFGLDLVRVKVLEAEEGIRKPSPDRMRTSRS